MQQPHTTPMQIFTTSDSVSQYTNAYLEAPKEVDVVWGGGDGEFTVKVIDTSQQTHVLQHHVGDLCSQRERERERC